MEEILLIIFFGRYENSIIAKVGGFDGEVFEAKLVCQKTIIEVFSPNTLSILGSL